MLYAHLSKRLNSDDVCQGPLSGTAADPLCDALRLSLYSQTEHETHAAIEIYAERRLNPCLEGVDADLGTLMTLMCWKEAISIWKSRSNSFSVAFGPRKQAPRNRTSDTFERRMKNGGRPKRLSGRR